MNRSSDDATTVDWGALRERLAASVQGAHCRPAREVLAERARALARPLDTSRGAAGGAVGAETPALVVTAGEGHYALPLADVVEIVRPDRLVPLPGAEGGVAGVLPWRGRVLAVHRLVPETSSASADERRVVVVGTAATPLALLVDGVAAVQSMPSALFDVAPAELQRDAAAARVPTLGVTPDAVAALDVAELRRRVDEQTDSSR